MTLTTRRPAHGGARWRGLIACVVVLAVVVSACGGAARAVATPRPPLAVEGETAQPSASIGVGPASQSGGVAAPSPSPSRVPAFAHIYVLMLENQAYSAVIGTPAAPYLNSLGHTYGIASNYHGVAHPSQPNYIALFAGSTHGVSDDGKVEVTGRNLLDQLEEAGKSWAVYEQGYPGGCFAGETSNVAQDGPGAAGQYVREHNPAISFLDVESDASRCGRIHSFAAFDPAAANFELIVPNECNDMHSCSVGDGDRFLAAFLPQLIASPDFAGSLLVVVADEGTDNSGGGGRVPAVVVSPLGRQHFVSNVAHDHFSLLRTIEDAWGLPCLEQACQASDLAEFFR